MTGNLIWDDVPAGLVIRELLDQQSSEPLIKVVTRASAHEEIDKFQHPRMPLLELPLFPIIDIPALPDLPELL